MNRSEPEARIDSDEHVLAEFLAGGEEQFSELVRRYSHELYQFIFRFVRNGNITDDLVQETFIQVYQSASGFDASRRFRPWLFTIAANKARDYLRGRVRRREVPLAKGTTQAEATEVSYLDFLADDAPLPGEVLEANEQRDVVRAIVSDMPDHLREVLVLGYYQRLPYKEIAEVLSIPLGTVKSRLHAAVSHFAAAYRRAEDDAKVNST